MGGVAFAADAVKVSWPDGMAVPEARQEVGMATFGGLQRREPPFVQEGDPPVQTGVELAEPRSWLPEGCITIVTIPTVRKVTSVAPMRRRT